MLSFEEYLNENSDLEAYRKEALNHIKQLSPGWQKLAGEVLGKKIHKVIAIGSVTDKKRFHEGSDVDVAFHYSDPSKPDGLDEKASEILQREMVHNPHHHLGVINTLVFSTHKKGKT
jgi:hypothetical protein